MNCAMCEFEDNLCSACRYDYNLENQLVNCDINCGASLFPETLEESKKTCEHWKNHSWMSGCSHGGI